MRLLKVITLLIGLSCSFAQAGLFPETEIEHERVTVIAPGSRVLLEAEITDPARVDRVRCYFRTAADSDYLFTPMIKTTGDVYSCPIPAIKISSASLEYLFVVVNKKAQVIRSKIYTVEIRHQTTLPPWQQLVSNEDKLKIYDELDLVSYVPDAFNDSKVDIVPIEDKDDLFGLKVDIYGIDQLPVSLKAVPGYFGGFSIETDGTVWPVKGYAVDLKHDDLSALHSFIRVIHEDALNLTGDNWQGEFYRTDSSGRQSITASATHSGNSIDIDTSRSNSSIAGRFVGDINSKGDMFVYDVYDNEIWTTYFGPARQERFVLADFVYKPIAGQPRPPLYIVEMDRELPPHFNIAPIMELLL